MSHRPSKLNNEEMHCRGLFKPRKEQQNSTSKTGYSAYRINKPVTTKTIAACAEFHWARGLKVRQIRCFSDYAWSAYGHGHALRVSI
jgi:hypothetical protein